VVAETEQGKNPVHTPDDAPGGARFRALDLTNAKDQALTHNYLKRGKRRWAGISDELKVHACNVLGRALNIADLCMDGPDLETKLVGANLGGSTVRTLQLLEGQNQSDEHLAHKTTEDGGEKHVHYVQLVAGIKPSDY
jgi:hypothetical protein